MRRTPTQSAAVGDFRVTDIRSMPADVTRDTGLLARFNVDLGVVALVGCVLVRTRTGEIRIGAPKPADRRMGVSLPARTRERILKAARRAYCGLGYELPDE